MSTNKPGLSPDVVQNPLSTDSATNRVELQKVPVYNGITKLFGKDVKKENFGKLFDSLSKEEKDIYMKIYNHVSKVVYRKQETWGRNGINSIDFSESTHNKRKSQDYDLIAKTNENIINAFSQSDKASYIKWLSFNYENFPLHLDKFESCRSLTINYKKPIRRGVISKMKSLKRLNLTVDKNISNDDIKEIIYASAEIGISLSIDSKENDKKYIQSNDGNINIGGSGKVVDSIAEKFQVSNLEKIFGYYDWQTIREKFQKIRKKADGYNGILEIGGAKML